MFIDSDLAVKVLSKCYASIWAFSHAVISGKVVSGFGKYKSKLKQVNFDVLCQRSLIHGRLVLARYASDYCILSVYIWCCHSA